jgi:hypothetical protein
VPLDLIQNALQICVGPYLDEQEFRDVNTINAQVQGEFLEKAVWREVSELLTSPERLEREYQDRSREGASLGNLEALNAQRLKLQHALERLIHSFTEGLIDKDQFTSRMGRTKSRIADLDVKIKSDAGDVNASKNSDWQ